jgi:hypothetical protein
MPRPAPHYLPVLLCAGLLTVGTSARGALEEIELSGNISGEYRYFFDSGTRPGLASSNVSVSTEPEFYYRIPDSRDSVTFTPFYRLDEHDDDRSHGDIRELNWHKVARDWELTLGIDRVFWGVTETAHVVNIINQIDLVESPDQEDLLGQPMINLTLIQDWGSLDMFVLPYFRERTFPGTEGRPGSQPAISNSKAIYDSSAEQWHTDLALRWANSAGNWDLGAYHFYGTSREPRVDPAIFEIKGNGDVELIPIYDIINQTGVDIQGTFDAWLLKLEAIYRAGPEENFFSGAAGFEYTFFDVAGSGVDIGIVSEYLFDDRALIVTTDNDDNDISLGLRLGLNDINSTQLLAAAVQDVDDQSRYFFIEASRRIGNAFKLSIEARGVDNVADDNPLRLYEDENYLQLELGYYF